MPEAIRCAACGAALPANWPQGLCSRCALQGALELPDAGSQVLPPEDSASSSPPPPPTPAGQLPTLKYFGDYELLQEIARGGMGIVYKARQVSLDRVVAVKLLLLGEYASEEFIHRFRIEASAAASLQHPNIVAIHEVGVHQGQHYFAMDFVDGPNLAQLVRDQPLTARRGAGYVKIIAEAIHLAHTRGILHRDLKPSNVLIDSNDQPRVTDFGLAKNLANDSALTVTGQVLGSPSFMPPEQALGERGKMTPASDVYSLGAILYHALTGRPPFVGQSVADTLQQVQNQEPIPPRLLNSSVPRDLETICLKCLQKEPGKRYSSALELAQELGRFLGDEPICARPVSPPEKLWRWCQRKPALAGMAVGIVLIASIGVAGWEVARKKSAAAALALVGKAKADQDAARETKQAAKILQANNEFLVQHGFKDTNNSRGPALLKALDEAIGGQPSDLALWQAKTEVLKRANRPGDALDTLSRAIDLASTDTNLPYEMHIEMLLTRSRLLQQMGRKSEANTDYSEAGRINCKRKGILDRKPQTKPEMLDLSPFFQSNLSPFLDMLSADGPEAVNAFGEDVKRDTGVEFDLRGGLNILGRRKNSPPPYQYLSRPPELLTGIAVNRRFVRLHVLHSVWGSAAANARMAAYVLHYVDGQITEIPILYGQHVRDVWMRDRRSPTAAQIAWQGDSIGTSKDSRGVRFFKATWENPRPEVEVRSIDLALRSANVFPILLGITVESAEPGSPEFWTTKAYEAEERGESAEALKAYAQAIGIVSADTNRFQEARSRVLLMRASLWKKLGHFEEAAVDNLAAIGIPRRSPHLGPDSVDLSLFYNYELTGVLRAAVDSKAIATIEEAARKKTGVQFDVRGIVALSSQTPDTHLPGVRKQPLWQAANDIPVKRRFKYLYILHGTSKEVPHGTIIGSYVLHYVDGRRMEFPIVYGRDLLNWWGGPIELEPANAELAWTETIDTPEHAGAVRLYKISRENPFPDVEVTSMDFIGAKSACGPFLYAVTVKDETPDTPEFWLQKAKTLTEKGDTSRSLAILEDGVKKLPNSMLLWNAKGRLLQETGRTGEALAAFSRAIDLANTDLDAGRALLVSARTNRASLLASMSRFEEAATDNLAVHGISPRGPDATVEMLDLSLYYNYELLFNIGLPQGRGSELKMETDVFEKTGVRFDLRGMIAMGGKRGSCHHADAETQPKHLSFTGIRVNQRCSRLHILHSTSKVAPAGTTIANYVVHYADNRTETIPVVFDRNISVNWGMNAPVPKQVELAWERPRQTRGIMHTIRLYKISWENPRPEVEVKSLDFISTETEAAPYLIAVTVDP